MMKKNSNRRDPEKLQYIKRRALRRAEPALEKNRVLPNTSSLMRTNAKT